MSTITDISLITRVLVFDDKKAFDRLVGRYQEPVRRFFLGQTLGDRQLSDDLAQETFIKAYTRLRTFRGVSGFSTWLYRIAYNVLYDYRRAAHHTEELQQAEDRANDSNADSTLKTDLYEGLRTLKHEERFCLTLQLMEGVPIEKISEITGMAAGTVKSHISRGKQKLATYLKQNGYDR